MNITAVSYNDIAGSRLRVYADGLKHIVPWPCSTWHREVIEAWLADGNTISPAFTPEELADQALQEQERQANAAARQEVREDSVVQTFVGMTPAEVRAYVDANGTNLAGLRQVVKLLAVIVLALAKQ